MRKLLWNEWTIKEKLGEGKYASVYKATKQVDSVTAKCAIKYISIPSLDVKIEDLVNNKIIKNNSHDEIERYCQNRINEIKKEMQIMYEFKGNPSIVDVYDYFLEKKPDGIGYDIYIRMELCEDVNNYFKNRRIKTSDIIQLGINVCSALELCSKINIIHKDIKPSNIFVGEDGVYKLGDFGISDTINSTIDNIDGTLNYISPEVYLKKNLSFATDIYSLGILMYRFLNHGKLPFQSDTVNEMEAFKVRMEGKEIIKIPGVDDKVMDIILKACSFDTSKRYKSASEMKQDLLNIYESSTDGNIVNIRDDKTISVFDMSQQEIMHVTNSNKNSIKINSDIAKKNNFKNIFNKVLKLLGVLIIGIILLFLVLKCSANKKCEDGKIRKNGICVKGHYTCPDDYTLNKDNKCAKVVKSIDANKKYKCEDGYELNGNQCIMSDTMDSKYGYQCAAGFKLVGKKCIKEVGTDAIKTASCPNGYYLLNNKCYNASSVSVSLGYTCPSGYTLAGTKCTKTENNPSYLKTSETCPAGKTIFQSGTSKYCGTLATGMNAYSCNMYAQNANCKCSGFTCYTNISNPTTSKTCSKGVYTNGTCVITTTVDATKTSTCPNGYKVYQGVCVKETTVNPTYVYTCPNNTTKRDNKCYTDMETDAVLGNYCEKKDYVYTGTQCLLSSVKEPNVEYSCSKIYTLNNDKCEKYDLIDPTPNYE